MDGFAKGLLMGLGLGLMAKDGAQDALAKAAEALGSLAGQAQDEARIMARAVAAQFAERAEQMRDKGKAEAMTMAREAGMATQDELVELRARLAALEKLLEERESSDASGTPDGS
ncbi:hypothetical protein dsat_0537 [Alkalidesulfovibrio alkalitolerans DSM 16529]|uniref:Phasin family protein n=1 Tax=Alkalidesulfovibrio alkalitolerans DSM 16529 TaxID=1121439 RepID=S7T913_9BACT|nr:hypothetical protein [Alkalidesulfovibrio alkalitolerans]EPR33096.1 hypothetical protein dsat_0537 [Alkalidesulfovibrio alkalitolerans DSM 16529]